MRRRRWIRPLLVRWWGEFGAEALGALEQDDEQNGRSVDHRLTAPGNGIALWEVDGEPVCAVGYGSPTPTGVRIGPVYTPPAHRGRGYASALTAHVSTEQLAGGRSFCFLYTDLANPTSNKIYAAIGYRRVCDSIASRIARWRLSSRPTSPSSSSAPRRCSWTKQGTT